MIEPKYSHAWIFSDGLASVDEGGYIKFIDATGKVVIDKKMAYIPNMEGYVFHGGYCVVDTDDGEQCGLMDKKGNIVLPLEYSSIHPTNDFKLWRLQKGDERAVLDSELKPILPLSECSIYIGDGTIDVTLPDHTMRKYDMEGNLINDFYISSLRMLEYEKEEILYRTRTHDDDGDEYAVPFVEEYHPQAVARLRAYVAGDGYEGLMTADGHKVTMPLYKDIEAIAGLFRFQRETRPSSATDMTDLQFEHLNRPLFFACSLLSHIGHWNESGNTVFFASPSPLRKYPASTVSFAMQKSLLKPSSWKTSRTLG